MAKRPSLRVPKRLLLTATVGAGLLSFAPILSTTIVMSEGIGFWFSFKNVVFVFDVGQAWLFTAAMAVLLLGLIHFNQIEQDPFIAKIGVILCVLMIAGYAKAGHAASLLSYTGFISHFLHLLAVVIWAGCLLVAAWFTKKERDLNWTPFLSWFHPLALIAMSVVIIAGLVTMNIDIAKPLDHSVTSTIEQYRQGLFSNYGQALLIKHLFILPLLIYALFNGFLGKKLRNYQTRKWVRAESILVIIIFAVTAFMGQQPPPHQPEQYLSLYGPSPLFSAIYQSDIPNNFIVHFGWSLLSSIFIGFGCLLFILMILSIVKKLPAFFSIVMGCAAAFGVYLAIMSAIV